MMQVHKKLWATVAAVPLVPLALVGYLLRGRGRSARDGSVLLSYSQVIWDEVWQRPQEHARRSARYRNVVYCCPVQVHNWFYSLGLRWKTRKHEQHGEFGLSILSPLILPGHFKSRLVHDLNCWIVSQYLVRELRGYNKVHSLANTPFSWGVLSRLFFANGRRDNRLKRLVYDLIDDFIAFDWAPKFGRNFERELLHAADAVVAGTRQLSDDREDAQYIPCGVDFAAFEQPRPLPGELIKLPRPLIGYIGTISERIDFELIRQVAEAFPGASLVLVGPVHSVDDLPRLPNIHYMGLRPHSEVPAFAQAFDVALIPFRISPATMKLHPVKTLEYLAAGVPVVSTALPEVQRFYADVVSIADTPESFVTVLHNTLSTPNPARKALGKDRARAASWEAMTLEINRHVFPETPVAQPVLERQGSHA